MSVFTYIILIALLLAVAGHASFAIWKSKKQLHILQLNSYFNQRYVTWLSTHKLRAFHWHDLVPLIALVGLAFNTPLVTLLLYAILYFRLFLTHSQKPEKKPLVFTARALRLFSSNLLLLLVLYISAAILLWHHDGNAIVLVLIVLTLFSWLEPLWLLLLNWLLTPLEYLIQQRYFNEAQKIVQQMVGLKVIGITGSFGKTTTKYVLHEILKRKFNTLMTPGSYNTTMGVTKVIRSQLQPVNEIFVVEMSAKKPGDIAELCHLVPPQYGLITAIGEQHLETFHSLENIVKTKSELVVALPHDGIAFLNMDDPNCSAIASRAGCRVVGYGMESPQAEYRVTDITIDGRGSNFTVTSPNNKIRLQTKLLGLHNIYNILAAVAVASEMGISLAEMQFPIRSLAAIPHRLELKQIGNDIVFIDDAFNSNPVGSKMALDVLKQIKGKRKIIITPGMVELGAKEFEYNKRFGEFIAAVCDYVILVGKKQTIAIQEGLIAQNYSPAAMFIADDFANAKQHLEKILQKGDVVLFENDLPDNY